METAKRKPPIGSIFLFLNAALWLFVLIASLISTGEFTISLIIDAVFFIASASLGVLSLVHKPKIMIVPTALLFLANSSLTIVRIGYIGESVENLMSFIGGLFAALASIALLLILLAAGFDKTGKQKAIAGKLKWLPGVLFLLAGLLGLISSLTIIGFYIREISDGYLPFSFIGSLLGWGDLMLLLLGIASFFVADRALDPYRKDRAPYAPAGQPGYAQQPGYAPNPGATANNPYANPTRAAAPNAAPNAADPAEYGEIYYSLATHIVLCLLLGGIWQYVWIYRATRYLNRTPGEEYCDPTNKLLLCLFVPFYSIYWYYRHGQKLGKLMRARNLPDNDVATLCLVLGILLPIGACILMQDKFNKLCTAGTQPAGEVPPVYAAPAAGYTAQPGYTAPAGQPAAPVYTAPAAPAGEDATIAALQQYKALLDQGVITQEEFDAKKRQLLGL